MGLEALAADLHTLAQAAARTGVPIEILEELTADAPPSWVLYQGRVRYPLLTPDDIEAATGVRPR